MLYVIDGDGLLYRAAFAVPHCTNDAGMPTNARHETGVRSIAP